MGEAAKRYNFQLKDLHPLHRAQVRSVEKRALKELRAFVEGLTYSKVFVQVIESPMELGDSPGTWLVWYCLEMPDGSKRDLLGFRHPKASIPRRKA